MVEVDILDTSNFLKIKETLTRIGDKTESLKTDKGMKNVLIPLCNILFKRKKYYIVHYKELMQLDGEDIKLTPEEYGELDYIVNLLEQWNLCKRVDGVKKDETYKLTVIKFSDKNNWIIKPQYIIGIKHDTLSSK